MKMRIIYRLLNYYAIFKKMSEVLAIEAKLNQSDENKQRKKKIT